MNRKADTWYPGESHLVRQDPISYETLTEWLNTLKRGGVIDEKEYQRKLKEEVEKMGLTEDYERAQKMDKQK